MPGCRRIFYRGLLQRRVSNCASFILLIFKAKRKNSKGTAPRKRDYTGTATANERTTRAAFFIQSYEQRGSQPAVPGALMPASESSLPPLESFLSKARLQEQHLFRAQHHARTRAKTMTMTNSSTPPPPWTCSTVKTKIPAADDLSCPDDSPVAVVTVGESTATSRGPHMLRQLSTSTLRFTLLFKPTHTPLLRCWRSQRRPRIAST